MIDRLEHIEAERATMRESRAVLHLARKRRLAECTMRRFEIFDPFFTTKGVDRGTGQGLAIARSVVAEITASREDSVCDTRDTRDGDHRRRVSTRRRRGIDTQPIAATGDGATSDRAAPCE